MGRQDATNCCLKYISPAFMAVSLKIWICITEQMKRLCNREKRFEKMWTLPRDTSGNLLSLISGCIPLFDKLIHKMFNIVFSCFNIIFSCMNCDSVFVSWFVRHRLQVAGMQSP